MTPNHRFWRDRSAAVTGATSVVGWRIVDRLTQLGARVRALGPPPSPNHPIRRCADVEFIAGDVRHPDVVRSALDRAEIVFHAAGPAALWELAVADFDAMHADGWRTVAAAAPPSARIVLTSCVAAVGATLSGTPLTEEAPFPSTAADNPHIAAKRATELAALQSGRDVVVVNPGFAIGPGDDAQSGIGGLVSGVLAGRLPLTPPAGLNVVDARDVADGHLLAAERGATGRRYILGGENLTLVDLVDAVTDAAGIEQRRLRLWPETILRCLAAASRVAARWTGRPAFPLPHHLAVTECHWFVRSDRARAELGYEPQPVAAAIADAVQERLARRGAGLLGRQAAA